MWKAQLLDATERPYGTIVAKIVACSHLVCCPWIGLGSQLFGQTEVVTNQNSTADLKLPRETADLPLIIQCAAAQRHFLTALALYAWRVVLQKYIIPAGAWCWVALISKWRQLINSGH